MSAAHEQYALGRSPQEYARLARQAEIMKPMTRRLFAEAGVQPGMRVVDLGSGAGDVCMLLAEMVGLSGTVIGLDLDKDALLHARERAAAAGFANITFAHSDFAHYVPDAPLDAIVGRLVLMYQADPAAALAKLTPYLRPGGVVAFIEPWFQPPPGRREHREDNDHLFGGNTTSFRGSSRFRTAFASGIPSRWSAAAQHAFRGNHGSSRGFTSL